MLCPAAEDAALCEEYVRGYWSEIICRDVPQVPGPQGRLQKAGRLHQGHQDLPCHSHLCRVPGAQDLKTLRPVNRVSPI